VPLDGKGWPIVDAKTGETARSNVFLIGDVQKGPSSIVAAIGDARRATDVILGRESLKSHHGDKYWLNANPAAITARKGAVVVNIVKKDELRAFVKQEGERCLQCNYVCSKCVDVCPNRANISIAVPGFKDRFQALHVDAFCNECGNCASFCPWQGRPYKDKPTIFNLRQDFDSSTNAGFLVEGSVVRVRQAGKLYELSIDAASRIDDAPPELSDLCRIITQVHARHGYLLGPVAE
jgi:putative selenate reductase